MENNIRNIYLMNLNPNSKMFVFSVTDPENPLKFDYYVLSLEKGLKPSVVKAVNILKSLKDYEKKIIKISEGDELYDMFRTSLENAKRLEIKIVEKKYPKQDTDIGITMNRH